MEQTPDIGRRLICAAAGATAASIPGLRSYSKRKVSRHDSSYQQYGQ